MPFHLCVLSVLALAWWGFADDGALPRIQRMEYPKLAAQAGIQGDVQVKCLLGTNGSVRKVTILKGARILGDAAAANVLKWKFRKPGGSGESEPVVFYHFELRGSARDSGDTVFTFEKPNKVSVIAARPEVMPSSSSRK